MKSKGHSLIRFLSAVLCWLIIFSIMLPGVPVWGSEDFRFFSWLFYIAAMIAVPSAIAFVILFFLPFPWDNEVQEDSGENESQEGFGDNPLDCQVITTEEDYAQFLSSHIIVASYDTKVVGVTFDNTDGSNRQSIISKCCSGDEIALQYFEYKGDPAYAVLTRHGQIGNLSSDQARIIDQNYDGCVVQGTIQKITGGYSGYPFGCNIHLTFFSEKDLEPDLKTTQFLPPVSVPKTKRRTPPADPPVSEQFIAEAQWYAAKDDSDNS